MPQNIFYIDRLGRLKYRDRCVLVDRDTWLLRVADCPLGGGGGAPTELWDTIRHSEVEGMIIVQLKKYPTDTLLTTLCPTQVDRRSQHATEKRMEWNEYFLNDTSAHCRLFSARKLETRGPSIC